MNRVATFGNYNSALMDLMASQTRAQQAQERLSTEKIATDLAGYGRTSEALTALKSTASRIDGFISVGEQAAARLAAQDLAMSQIYDGGDAARQAIANAMAAGRVDGLMNDLAVQYQTVQSGLNTSFQGLYLFAGAQTDKKPATATDMADLATAPSVAAVFANDTLTQKSRIDENTTLNTGFAADALGGPLTTVFRNMQLYQEGNPVTIEGVTYTPPAAGSITGQVGADLQAFLNAQLGELDKANKGVVNEQARNGLMQNHVDAALDTHDAHKFSLEQLVQDKSGIDKAQAITELEMAQIAIQASAQVVNSLRQTSLLDLLR